MCNTYLVHILKYITFLDRQGFIHALFCLCDENRDGILDDTETSSGFCQEIVDPITSYTDSINVTGVFDQWEPSLSRSFKDIATVRFGNIKKQLLLKILRITTF